MTPGERAREHVAPVLVGAEPVQARWGAVSEWNGSMASGPELGEVDREQRHDDPEQQDAGADQEGRAVQQGAHARSGAAGPAPTPRAVAGCMPGRSPSGPGLERLGGSEAHCVYLPYLTRGLSRAMMTSAQRLETM